MPRNKRKLLAAGLALVTVAVAAVAIYTMWNRAELDNNISSNNNGDVEVPKQVDDTSDAKKWGSTEATDKPKQMPHADDFQIIDLNTQWEFRAVYLNMYKFYYGTGDQCHYIADRQTNWIWRSSREIISEEEILNLYKMKASRDFSKYPAQRVGKRSKEFLDWHDDMKDKVWRIEEIEIRYDR